MSKKPENGSGVKEALRNVRRLSRKRATGRSQENQEQDTSGETGTDLNAEPEFDKDYLAKGDSDGKDSVTALTSVEKQVPVELETKLTTHRAEVKYMLADLKWEVMKWVLTTVVTTLVFVLLAMWGIVDNQVGGLRSDVREDIAGLRSTVQTDVGEVKQDLRQVSSRLDTLERQVPPLETDEE